MRYRVKGLKKTAYQLESLNLYHLRIRYKCCSSIYIGKAPVCLRLGRANIQTESKSGVSCLRNIQGEPDGTYVRGAAKFRNFSPGFEISTCKTVRHFYAYAKWFLLFIELEIGWHWQACWQESLSVIIAAEKYFGQSNAFFLSIRATFFNQVFFGKNWFKLLVWSNQMVADSELQLTFRLQISLEEGHFKMNVKRV